MNCIWESHTAPDRYRHNRDPPFKPAAGVVVLLTPSLMPRPFGLFHLIAPPNSETTSDETVADAPDLLLIRPAVWWR